jgi:hypothetical protein
MCDWLVYPGCGVLPMTAAHNQSQQTSAEPTRADFERVFQDACDEAGCAYDNEALLEAIASLKLQVKTYRDTNHVLRETLRVVQGNTEALKQAEESFEFIRLQLVGNLEEPERSAFWRAVEARNSIRSLSQAPVTDGAARPKAFLSWAVRMFGPVAKLRSERLMRFVEEAIELAHADEMERSVLDIIANRVYSRAPGEITREIGQAQACLETYAENIGESAALQAEIEWARVQNIPSDEWQRRHAAKQAIGIALSADEASHD